MNLATEAVPQGRVDQPVALQRALALKLGGHDGGLEMHAVVALDVDLGTRQAGGNEFMDDLWIHGWSPVGADGSAGRSARPGVGAV